MSLCIPLLIMGCNRPSTRIPLYKPHLEKAKADEAYVMSGILDTISVLFQKDSPGVEDRAYYYKLKGVYYRSIGDFVSSLTVLDSLKTLLAEHKEKAFYKELYPAMLLLMAEDYSELELYEHAITFLIAANKFIEANDSNECSKAVAHARIAEILMLQGRSKMAVQHFLECYKTVQPCSKENFDNFYYGYSSLYKISICYIKLEMYDSAQYYCDAAMNHVDSNQPRFPEKENYFILCKAVINASVAAIKAHEKQFDKAEQLLLSTIEKTAAIYPNYILYCKLDLLEVYLQANKLDKAKELLVFFDTAVNSNQAFFVPLQEKKIAAYNATYYEKKGDYRKAFGFAKEVIQYHDSVKLAKRYKVQRDPGLEFVNRSQIMTNDLLSERYERKSFQLAASVLLVILVVIVAAFIAVHLKRTQKHARMQEHLNNEIQVKNDEIKDAYTSLESSYRANTELMLTVAHDLKNPIVGITNLGKLILKNEQAKITQNIELIVAASINATNLINNLMDRSHSGQSMGEKKINDILRLVEYCVELMNPKAKEKKQRLYLHGESANALINKNEMWRVITNIINNAIKFSTENTTIDIELQKQKSKILLTVKDEGIGMPQDILEGLFKPGTEIQRAGTAGEPSYGLGLKISKRIVEQHEGSLWAESIEGLGSTFFIILPIANN